MSLRDSSDQSTTSDAGIEHRNCHLSLVGQTADGAARNFAVAQNTADSHLPSLELFANDVDERRPGPHRRHGKDHDDDDTQSSHRGNHGERDRERDGDSRRGGLSDGQSASAGAVPVGDNVSQTPVNMNDSTIPAATTTASDAATIPAATALADATTPMTSADVPVAPSADSAVAITGGNFSVTESGGFVSPDGKPFNIRGLNATVADAEVGFQNALVQYPDMTALRLNIVPGQDSLESIDKVIQEYTSRGIVVEAENHSADVGNIGWYSEMAAKYKDNPLVMLETPNEPSGDPASVASNQIEVIRAIRAAGYTNPIGVQPVGGYDESNFAMVTAAVGNEQLYATPHLYYYGSDPSGASDYMGALKQGASAQGLYSWFDEFGNDNGDGVTRAPQGDSVLTSVINANKSNQIAATFWAMDNVNHPDGTDSAYLTPDGSQLTPIGQQLQQWI